MVHPSSEVLSRLTLLWFFLIKRTQNDKCHTPQGGKPILCNAEWSSRKRQPGVTEKEPQSIWQKVSKDLKCV